MFCFSTFQGRLTGLELDLELVATRNLICFVQDSHFVDTLGKVDNGGISGPNQAPLGSKMRVKDENPIAIRVGTHVELVDEWMVVGQRAF